MKNEILSLFVIQNSLGNTFERIFIFLIKKCFSSKKKKMLINFEKYKKIIKIQIP